MSFYRNERIPCYSFLQKLKKVDVNLYVVFDSLSMRWDIYYKNPYDDSIHLVLRVCERDSEGRDVGYMELTDHIINKLLKMDMKRRNIAPVDYVNKVHEAEESKMRKAQDKYDNDEDYVYKQEKKTIDRAYEALRSIF